MASEKGRIIEEFIRQRLDEHAQWLSKRFAYKLQRNPNIKTGDLLKNMQSYEIATRGELWKAIDFDVPLYGRLFEIMGRKRRQNRAAALKEARNMGIVQQRSKKERKLKRTEWYAKTMYGGLGRLIAVLCAGISEAQMAELKRAIDAGDPGSEKSYNDILRDMERVVKVGR